MMASPTARRLVASLLIASLPISWMTAPAIAQGKGRAPDAPKSSVKEDPRKKKADEDAYQRALKTIPEPKGKIDPWQGAR